MENYMITHKRCILTLEDLWAFKQSFPNISSISHNNIYHTLNNEGITCLAYKKQNLESRDSLNFIKKEVEDELIFRQGIKVCKLCIFRRQIMLTC